MHHCLNQTHTYIVRLLNIFRRVSLLTMRIASMLLFSSTITTVTEWPFLLYTQEASCHIIRSVLFTETQSVSDITFIQEFNSKVRLSSTLWDMTFGHFFQVHRNTRLWTAAVQKPLKTFDTHLCEERDTVTDVNRVRVYTNTFGTWQQALEQPALKSVGSCAMLTQLSVDLNGVLMMVLASLQCTH